MKKEIRSLTGIRGLAALYVAYYHFLEPFDHPMQENLRNFIRHGYNAVDIFFILSGFVITLSSKKLFEDRFTWTNFRIFMSRRFARIYPIYLVITLLTFALSFRYLGWDDLVWNLLLLQVLPPSTYIVEPSWSLSAEWIAYLLFPVFFFFVYKFKSAGWNVMVLVFSFAILTYVSLDNGNFINGFKALPSLNGSLDKFYSVAACLRCFAEYLIGMTIYKIYSHYRIQCVKYIHFPAVPTVIFIIVCLCFHNTDLVLVFLFAVLIFSLSTDTGIIARLFGWQPVYFLGEISYSLYLIHSLLVRIDVNVFNRFKNNGSTPILIVNNIAFVTSLVVCSYFSYRFIEIPMRERLREKLYV